MRIAFTSCSNRRLFKPQAVWNAIAAHAPDALVLLGDSIYLDVPWAGATHPRKLSEVDFVEHGRRLYAAQLAEPGFAALVKAVPTHAIWDDHDFLWNESYEEGAAARPVHRGTVRATRALFRAWTETLDARLQGDGFPRDALDFRLWQPDEPAPGYRWRDLGGGVALHLTDGRSWRLGQELLGAAQRKAIERQIQALPADTVHLLASGSVVEQHKGDRWAQFATDRAWLERLARQHRVLVLSGDIHDNRWDALPVGPDRWLYDATSSGAAVSRLVVAGPALEHFGLVDIDAAQVAVSWFARGAPDRLPRRIARDTWRPLPA
jgi:hypothetical protein